MSQLNSYMYDGPCDTSITFHNPESEILEEKYWKQEGIKNKCKILEYYCKRKFLNSTIMIDKQECFSEISGKFHVSIDHRNNITQIYDSNKLVYPIQLISDLLIEKEKCSKIIEDTQNKLRTLKKEEYHLSNILSMNDLLINKLLEKVKENILSIEDNIPKNQSRIEQIEKELPIVFINFIKSNI
jgi:hypothetical protein